MLEKSENNQENNMKSIAVVGGGLAGLTTVLSLIEKLNKNHKITIFETQKSFGGNSAKATSGINAVGTNTGKKHNSPDNVPDFIKDTKKAGKDLGEAKLVEKLVKDSAKAIEFLETHGVDLPILSKLGGHSHPRTHRVDPKVVKGNVGGQIMKVLGIKTSNYANKNDRLKIFLNTRVTVMDQKEDGKLELTFTNVVEENAKPQKMIFDKVVLTSGGFGANKELIKEICGIDFPTTNNLASKGDGMFMAKKMGAKLINLEKVQVHPTGIVDPNKPDAKRVFLAPEAIRGEGGILLNEKAERFYNELQTRDNVSNAMNKHLPKMFEDQGVEYKVGYLLINEAVGYAFGMKYLMFYKNFAKILTEYKNGEDFCKKNNLDFEAFKKTFEKVNKYHKGEKDPLGRPLFKVPYDINEKMFCFLVTPSIHYTMGGIETTEKSQAVGKDGKIIKNLFIAGELIGSLHGDCRLGGNSLLDCVVFGRQAAQSIKEELEVK